MFRTNIEALKDLNLIKTFEKFLDNSTLKYILEQTLLYAVHNNITSPLTKKR